MCLLCPGGLAVSVDWMTNKVYVTDEIDDLFAYVYQRRFPGISTLFHVCRYTFSASRMKTNAQLELMNIG